MAVRFHRSRGYEVVLQDPRDGRRRGFFFDLSIGVEAPVNAESGMTVNLVRMDHWLALATTRSEWESGDFFGLLGALQEKLEPLVASERARLTRVELRLGPLWWALEHGDEEAGGTASSHRPEGNLERPCRRTVVARRMKASAPAPDFQAILAAAEGRSFEVWVAGPPPAGWTWVRFDEADPAGQETMSKVF